jgi:hypothetical protein
MLSVVDGASHRNICYFVWNLLQILRCDAPSTTLGIHLPTNIIGALHLALRLN